MAAQNLAESLDHFVVPVDDIVIAEEFYVRVFGGVITKRNGLNVRQRERGAVPHTFIQIHGKRMGVYLQAKSEPSPRSPADCQPVRLRPQRKGSKRSWPI
jgi:hypothetical protein